MDEFYNDHIQNNNENENNSDTPEVNFVMRESTNNKKEDNYQAEQQNNAGSGMRTVNNSFSESDTFYTSENQASASYESQPSSSYDYSYYHQDPAGNGYSGPDMSNGKKPKKKKGRVGRKIVTAACCGLAFGLVASGVFWGVSQATGLTVASGDSNGLSGINIVQTSSTGVSTIEATDVSDIVEQCMPSIVAVTTEIVTTQNFFGRTYSQEGQGAGSGIIFSQQDNLLYIMTNYHVIQDSTSINITFSDNSTAEASVLGYDEASDVAVLTVDYSSLSQDTKDDIAVAVIGDSDNLKVGNGSIAIGNALGYGMSVTTGPISALDREVQMTDGSMTLIQTQAAINPGNSGGALLNTNGEVIGINTVKYSDTDVEGMGFAIPINDAMDTVEGILNGTIVPKTDENTPYLGITGGTLDEEFVSQYGYPAGVYVSMVADGSAAARAGLQQGDIITAFNGTDLTTMDELQNLLAECSPGDQVTMTIQRQDSNGEFSAMELSTILGSKADATSTY